MQEKKDAWRGDIGKAKSMKAKTVKCTKTHLSIIKVLLNLCSVVKLLGGTALVGDHSSCRSFFTIMKTEYDPIGRILLSVLFAVVDLVAREDCVCWWYLVRIRFGSVTVSCTW